MQQDPHANFLARLTFPEPTRELSIEVDLVAEMAILNPFDFFLAETAEQFPFEYDAGERSELAPYLVRTRSGSLFRLPRLDSAGAAPSISWSI